MAMNFPEVRAFRMALEVIEGRNSRIGMKGNVRVLVCPPISEHAIVAHVIYLLVMFFFSERVGCIGVP
jgi:hypothetical protein